MKEISAIINDGIEKPAASSSSSSSSSSSISSSLESNISTTSKSKIFEMIRRICHATDMEKNSVDEGQCFTSLSYILGIVRFLALGSIIYHYLYYHIIIIIIINCIGLPFHPSIALAFKGSNCFGSYEESNATEKKSSEADIFECYLICCHNIIDGLLKCFIISLQSIDTNRNDSDTNHLKQAIMSIQAILDVLLDTTTAVSTTVQILGFQTLQKYVADKINSSDLSSSISSSSSSPIEDSSSKVTIALSIAESMIKTSKELFLENFLSKKLLSSADLSSTIAKSSSSDNDNTTMKSTAYPFSMSIGILGYACYEASLAASSLSLSIDKMKHDSHKVINLNIPSYSRNLDKLLIEVEDAYSKVVSIAMEDSLLEAAIDQSFKIYNNDINSGIVSNPNIMSRKSLRMKTKKRLVDMSDCSDIESDSGIFKIQL
jgi:hypothetical protein